jgi:hypothetical protein
VAKQDNYISGCLAGVRIPLLGPGKKPPLPSRFPPLLLMDENYPEKRKQHWYICTFMFAPGAMNLKYKSTDAFTVAWFISNLE